MAMGDRHLEPNQLSPRRHRRQKRIALWSAIASMVLCGGAGYAFRERLLEEWILIRFRRADHGNRWALAERLETFGEKGRTVVEEWYIEKLEDPQDEVEIAAAERLGKIKSVKAVPMLLWAMSDMTRWPEKTTGGHPELRWTATGREILVYRPPDRCRPFQQAIIDVGPDALPDLLGALGGSETVFVGLCSEAVHAVCAQIEGMAPSPAPEYWSRDAILPLLDALQSDAAPNPEIRHAAAQARAKIIGNGGHR